MRKVFTLLSLLLVFLSPSICYGQYPKLPKIYSDTELFLFEKNGRYGYKDSQNKVVVKPQFEEAEEFSKENVAKVKYKGKYGLISKDISYILEPKYDAIGPSLINGVFITNINDKYGIANNKGLELAPNEYENISYKPTGQYFLLYRDGLCSLREPDGKELLKDYVLIDYADGVFIVQPYDSNGKVMYGLYDRSGKQLLPEKYDCIKHLCWSVFQYEKNGKYGIIDKSGYIFGYHSYDGDPTARYNGVFIDPNDRSKSTVIVCREISGSKCYGWFDVKNLSIIVEPCLLGGDNFILSDEFRRGFDLILKKFVVYNRSKLFSIEEYDEYLAKRPKNEYEADKVLLNWMKQHLGPQKTQTDLDYVKSEVEKDDRLLDKYTESLSNSNLFWEKQQKKTFEERINGNIYTHSIEYYATSGENVIIAYHSGYDDMNHVRINNKDFHLSSIVKQIPSEFEIDDDKNTIVAGFGNLSNGDYVLALSVERVLSSGTYIITSPKFAVSQGQLITAPNGLSEVYESCSLCVLLTFSQETLSFKRIVCPVYFDDYWMAISKYGGLYLYPTRSSRSGGGVFFVNSENPIIKLDNNLNVEYKLYAEGREAYYCGCETENYLYLAGVTQEEGYVGFDNPKLIQVNHKGIITKKYVEEKKGSSFNYVGRRKDDLFLQRDDEVVVEPITKFDAEYVNNPENKPRFVYIEFEWVDGKFVKGFGLKDAGEWLMRPVLDKKASIGDYTIYPISKKSDNAIFSYKGKYGVLSIDSDKIAVVRVEPTYNSKTELENKFPSLF